MIPVSELIARLRELPDDWYVSGTNSGSLQVGRVATKVYELKEGSRQFTFIDEPYGYVFTDDRPARFYKMKENQ